MESILQTTRTKLVLLFRYLPLFLITFIGFLAGALGNIGLLSLFVGHCSVVPIATFIIRLLPLPFRVPWSDVGNLLPEHPNQISTVDQPTIITYWMAHMVFFFTYIVLNAWNIYSMPADPDASKWMVTNRKTKVMTVMVLSILIFVAFTFLRYMTTGVETWIGILTAIIVMVTIAYFWYYEVAARCGVTHGDMLGIVNQIIPASLKEDSPMTCVYAPKP